MTLVSGGEGGRVYRCTLPWLGPVAFRRVDLLVAGVAIAMTATTGLAETAMSIGTQRRLLWMHLGLAALVVGLATQRARWRHARLEAPAADELETVRSDSCSSVRNR